ncbi:MAG: hypothetical protein D6705_00220 [Deltaproteobacteria bacterium]|nr:MAG: hypothetical protein D6705_00220 [Deltaproteobacteria bacterium]
MIPYEVLVDALEAWKAQTAPPPQSGDEYVADDHLAEDVAGEEPPAYEEPEADSEGVEMMDEEMVLLDEDTGAVEAEAAPSYEMEIDEAAPGEDDDGAAATAHAEDHEEPEDA